MPGPDRRGWRPGGREGRRVREIEKPSRHVLYRDPGALTPLIPYTLHLIPHACSPLVSLPYPALPCLALPLRTTPRLQ
ncbi:hypothetical protein E2C01_071437 [Portunus trituberculatus]|uniref:Uncharacterized protein n=1 Tax=Portunus trituberculatus TaxID=210409 RepID=A0A5B7HX07_PORTR|nr:hypothetical protein [Portunus trituberculatus]